MKYSLTCENCKREITVEYTKADIARLKKLNKRPLETVVRLRCQVCNAMCKVQAK